MAHVDYSTGHVSRFSPRFRCTAEGKESCSTWARTGDVAIRVRTWRSEGESGRTWRRGRRRWGCSTGRRWTARWECTMRRPSSSPSPSSTRGFSACPGCGSSTASTSGPCCGIPDLILSFAHVRFGFVLRIFCKSHFLVDCPFIFVTYFLASRVPFLIENLGTLNPNVACCGSNCLFNWWDRGFLASEHGVEGGVCETEILCTLCASYNLFLLIYPITSSCLFMWRVHLQEMFEKTLG